MSRWAGSPWMRQRSTTFAKRRLHISNSRSAAKDLKRRTRLGARIAWRDDPSDDSAALDDGDLFADAHALDQSGHVLREVGEVDVCCDGHELPTNGEKKGAAASRT